MKQILSVFFLMASLISFGQTTSAFTVRSSDGSPFFIYINGLLQNAEAADNITVNDVADNTAVKIAFKNKKLGSFQQRVRCNEDQEFFVIRKIKGKYQLQEDEDRDDNLSINANMGGINMNVSVNEGSSSSSTSISHTTYETSATNGVNKPPYSSAYSDYRRNGYNCSAPTLTGKDFKEFEEAVKESYSDSRRISYIYKNIDKHCWRAEQVATLVKLIYNEDEQLKLAEYAYKRTYNIDDYDVVIDALSSAKKRIELREWIQKLEPAPSDYGHNNPGPLPETRGCRGASLSDNDFAEALRSAKKIAFEDTRIDHIKMISKNACLSVEQVRKLIQTFSFEDNRLEVAKLLYPKTYDKNKFYLVSDDFSFDSNKEALADFINAQPK